MSSLKVLVVEDDEANLELMTEVLASLEIEPHPLNDSQKAATLVSQAKFDGIFLDLEMPNLNGLALAQGIRTSSWNRSTPIVIVTGRDERDTMHDAFAAGATFFLQKPVDRTKLIRLFRTVHGAMVENRRSCARVPLQTNVTCGVGIKARRGRTWNLSQNGIQVETDNLITGETIHLAFRLPCSTVDIEAVGKVVWVKETRQGIQFTKISNQHHKEIREFISQAQAS